MGKTASNNNNEIKFEFIASNGEVIKVTMKEHRMS